jgi:benzoate/toluate 1,2-dioxygenase alpha subunit
MIEKSRNLCLYPNVYLMDQFSSQIRMYRPISVDKTEVTIYCIAPKGESAEARARHASLGVILDGGFQAFDNLV